MPVNSGTKVGELYAVSGLESDNSVVENGALKGSILSELIKNYGEKLLGETVFKRFGYEFPLLIKFIDANDDLSIQVHPNDKQAKTIQGGNGKTEMWYIIDCDEDAKLISGFKRPLTENDFNSAFNNGELMDVMGVHYTKVGDAFFIPAGKVHSIGKGNFIAEIQQTSDITYRIYDFDRKDKEGNKRDLHYNQAAKVINFEDADSGKVITDSHGIEPVNLASCQYFITNLVNVDGNISRDYSGIDSFVILINTGTVCVVYCDGQKYSLSPLESILLPASIENVKIESVPKSRLLEVYVG